jgi:hypothetical protein
MISPVRPTRSASRSPTIVAAREHRQLYPPRPDHVRRRSLIQETALECNENPPNPLWIIVVGMAVFFVVAAFLMLQG